MNWMDIVSIVFVCVTAIHLGLVGTIESIIGKKMLVLGCSKCLTFWCTLVYCSSKVTAYVEIPTILAISFLASYIALWLELFEAYIDTLYLKLYEKITSACTDDAVASDPYRGDSDGTVPRL